MFHKNGHASDVAEAAATPTRSKLIENKAARNATQISIRNRTLPPYGHVITVGVFCGTQGVPGPPGGPAGGGGGGGGPPALATVKLFPD